ncbi:MAG: DUF5076 domain-containing protein [Sphingorhabdus sp.]
MSDKPIPIDLVPYADMIGGAREFLRVWAKPEGPVTCFINPVPMGPDPLVFGMALVDCIRHGAKTYAQATGISERDALARIWQGVDAERGTLATDNTPPNVDENGLIQ